MGPNSDYQISRPMIAVSALPHSPMFLIWMGIDNGYDTGSQMKLMIACSCIAALYCTVLLLNYVGCGQDAGHHCASGT